MKLHQILILILLFCSAAVAAPNPITGQKENYGIVVEVPGPTVKALAIAMKQFDEYSFDIEKYVISVRLDGKKYIVAFSNREKPDGYRGSVVGAPDFVLEINQESFEITKTTFAR